MMKLFNNKGEIPVATGIMIVLIFFAIPILYFFVIIPYVLDTTHEERFEKAEKIQYELAEKPLQEFNETIYKNISFSGDVVNIGHARNQQFPRDIYWYVVNLDKPLYNPKKCPLSIQGVYDFTKVNEAKIFFYEEPANTPIEIWRSIDKKMGNTYYSINYYKDKRENILYSRKVYYTTEFSYFWTVKDLSKILDTIPKVPIWRK